MRTELYKHTIGEVNPSTFHRREDDERFEEDILKSLGHIGVRQAEDATSHFDFHVTDDIKLEIKQRAYPFYRFNTQFVPTSKLPKLVDAYERRMYNTLYLIRDSECRLFYFWVSVFTSEDLLNMPTFYDNHKQSGSRHNSRVFKLKASYFKEAGSLDEVADVLSRGVL